MTPIVAAVRRFFDAHGIEPCPIVVAVSGGVDSTALLLALADLRPEGFEIRAAHVNHQLRGVDSDEDERFVRSLCSDLAVPVDVVAGPLDPQRIRDGGVEAAAREVRHERIAAIASAAGARYVATAHQKEDQAETVLMRLMTGTGLAGLRGIHPRRGDGWLRPLLQVTRAEIEEFLRERRVTPRIDRMNSDPRFLRTRVRSFLRESGPEAVENLASVAEQAQQVWPMMEKALDAVERSCTLITPEETRFLRWPDDVWLRQALLNRHIRRLGGSREVSSDDLRRLASSVGDIRRVSVTRDLELIHRRGALVLRRRPEQSDAFEIELVPGSSAYISEIGKTISVRRVAARPDSSPSLTLRVGMTQLFQLPGNAEPHFIVRSRRSGDRFQPLGLPHDKKLKDFLIDRKIDAEIRDAIPLLIWNGEIVWIAGVEISERFKVTAPASTVYEVKLEDASHDGESHNGV